LEISDINKTKAKLSWQPSEKDGGSPIIGYIIEKREGWKSTYIVNLSAKRKYKLINYLLYGLFALKDISASRGLDCPTMLTALTCT
jgi:hypothetical protein